MIICLIGKQRAGKDTVADYLVERYGFKKMSLADKVKEVARDLFFMEGKDRDLLIKVGMKMREIDPNVWVKYLIRQMQTHDGRDFVIPDVRFRNEVQVFSSMFAAFFRVHADYSVRSRREGYTPEHEFDRSEIELDGYETDFRLDNNGTLRDLYGQVDEAMRLLGRYPR